MADFGQGGVWHFEYTQQFRIPACCSQIKELGAGRIAHIGRVNALPGKIPENPAVYCPQTDLVPGDPACVDLLQQPARFASGKKRINRQTSSFPEEWFQTLFPKPLTKVSRSPALPDNCRSQRPATAPVPDQDGFSLVRN